MPDNDTDSETPRQPRSGGRTDEHGREQTRHQTSVDLSSQTTHRERYGVTEEGTANPDSIQSDEIRQAVEEARERAREQNDAQAQHGGDGDTSTEEGDTGRSDAPSAREAAEDAPRVVDGDGDRDPVTTDPPELQDEPTDADDFFEDELGDPRREYREAQAAGLHADSTPNEEHGRSAGGRATAAGDSDGKPTSDAASETETMTDTDNNQTREQGQNRTTDHAQQEQGRERSSDTQTDTDTDRSTRSRSRSRSGAEARQQRRNRDRDRDARTPAEQGQGQGQGQGAAQTGGASDAQDGVEQLDALDEDAREDVDAAMGAGTDGEETTTNDHDPETFDYESQDIEGASEDSGTVEVEFNGVRFLLEDVNDQRAEKLMSALQDEALEPEDRFDVIIDTVVQRPEKAAARTSGWKYLHRATLAGRCMEHCGLDDIVDFRPE